MRAYEIIEKKRDGKRLTYEEIKYFVIGFTNGEIPDYQVSALLMAIYFQGMDEKETADLTEIMVNSGDRIDLSGIPGIKVDKHSSGGVGDKTTLILAPIVAACGVPVAKLSGKGLGHTGGTIDKLDSITGFNTSIDQEVFIENVKKIGISIAGQTGHIVPADKKLYALRDVTATVNNISLISSSIMSKKIASGADKIVLDVKTGSGAFMKTLEDSIALACEMVKIGKNVGRETIALVTDMDIPLGNAIGNSLEVIEAMDTLKGKGPKDLETISVEISARMLCLTGFGNMQKCIDKVKSVIEDGSALNKFKQLIENQGGNPEIVNNYDLFHKAEYKFEVFSNNEGYIESMETNLLGMASLVLGAGRETKESNIDYSAGIYLHKKTGHRIAKGEKLATLFTNNEGSLKEAERIILESITFSDLSPELRPIILAVIDSEGVKKYF